MKNDISDQIMSFHAQERVEMESLRIFVPTNSKGSGARSQTFSDDDSSLPSEPTAVEFLKPNENIFENGQKWLTVKLNAKNNWFSNNAEKWSISITPNGNNSPGSDVPRVDQRRALKEDMPSGVF